MRTKKYYWMTNELLDLCDERRRLKSIKNTSTENAQEYWKINSILRKGMKYTKEKWIYKECLSIDQVIRNGIHSKRVYQTLKTLTNSSTKKQTRVIENKDGDTISEDTEMVNKMDRIQ